MNLTHHVELRKILHHQERKLNDQIKLNVHKHNQKQ